MKNATLLAPLISFLVALQSPSVTSDPVKSAVEKSKTRPFWFRLNTIFLPYIPLAYEATGTTTKFDGNGAVKGSFNSTYEFTPVAKYFTLSRVLAQNHRPPQADVKKRFDDQSERDWEDFKKKSDKEKQAHERNAQQKIAKRLLFWDEFLRAYQFELMGHIQVAGRQMSKFAFTPQSSYKPGPAEDAKYLPKLRGEVWIDDADREIAHLAFEFTEDVSGFVGFGKIYKGSRYTMDLAKQLDGLWLPSKAETYLADRILFSKSRQTFAVEYSNYRRFGTDVKIEVLK